MDKASHSISHDLRKRAIQVQSFHSDPIRQNGDNGKGIISNSSLATAPCDLQMMINNNNNNEHYFTILWVR